MTRWAVSGRRRERNRTPAAGSEGPPKAEVVESEKTAFPAVGLARVRRRSEDVSLSLSAPAARLPRRLARRTNDEGLGVAAAVPPVARDAWGRVEGRGEPTGLGRRRGPRGRSAPCVGDCAGPAGGRRGRSGGVEGAARRGGRRPVLEGPKTRPARFPSTLRVVGGRSGRAHCTARETSRPGGGGSEVASRNVGSVPFYVAARSPRRA